MKRFIYLIACLFSLSCSTAQPPSGPRTFTDVSLVGYWHRDPMHWDAARFAPHVSWQAPDGTEHWLFEAFLFLEGVDRVQGKNLVISPSGTSAGKDSWQYQLDL